METLIESPHRVVYLQFGKYTTKVFPNLEKALNFAESQKEAAVQPASEKPNIQRACNKLTRNAGMKRVPCSCGKRNRLSSEQYCVICSASTITSNR